MRAHIDPSIVHVIPNAIDAAKFIPDLSKRCKDRIKIIVVSRLVYRKGVDLLQGIIPQICHKFPDVDFIIGGDGAKRSSLQTMVDARSLHQRVEFLGAVPHASVRDVLTRGHIFLNCSLTESFCIAILEAAATGLFVVSTDVGGVPEVLPDDMIYMAEPSVAGLVRSLSSAIQNKVVVEEKHDHVERIRTTFDPLTFHQRIEKVYCWSRIASETVSVYERVLEVDRLTFLERLDRYKSVGDYAGVITFILAVTLHFYVTVVEWWQPRCLIDVVPDLTLGAENSNDSTSPQLNTDKAR